MARKGYETDIRDGEWAIIEPLVQRKGKMGRPVRRDLREIVNALFYWERTGCHWRLLPADFPNWTSVRYYIPFCSGVSSVMYSCLSRSNVQAARKR